MEPDAAGVPQTLGSYRIEGLLGRGGMGVVYRAHDSRLGRDVAIKILPSLFLADAERRARFEREARLLASVSHPNIGAIYGFEQAGDVGALVLELVEGPTLAERISDEPISVADALAIARQIADALDAAHDRGIVHRDLKPLNIKVRPDGTVKVLDFGLAKARADGADSSDWSQSPTVTDAGTREGLVVGTVAYMSPEQARGRPVDKRSDIWGFGCILYEMLTGRAAFGRETLTDTLAAIVDRDPDWTALPEATPSALRRLLARCLEKDPRRRLHDIADARIEIDDVIANPVEAVSTHATAYSRRREYLAWGAAVVCLGLAVAAVLLAMRRAPDPAAPTPITRTAVVFPSGEQLSGRGREYPLALSADGTHLAYVSVRAGQERLYVRRLDELEARDLPGTLGARQPFFSPDGQWIGFFAENALQKISVAGGLPIRICDVPGISLGGAWGADDTIVFAVFQSALFKVGASGGTAKPLWTGASAWPEILPDGRTVLFTSAGAAIVAIDLAGGNSRTLAGPSVTPGQNGAARLSAAYIKEVRYLPTGHLIYGEDPGSIRAVPFDVRSLTLHGSPVSLVDGVYTASNGGATYFAVSKSGLLAYARESRQRELQWVDRNGRGTPISDDRERFRTPRLSPDGKRVAVVIDSELRRSDIWIYDTARRTRTRLTTEKHNLTPVWTPDGSRIAHYSSGVLVSRPADGSGSEDVLLSGATRYPNSWSPDGRELLFHADDPVSGADLWVFPKGADAARALLLRPFNDWEAKFSRDGRWIAYASNESARDEVYVMSYPGLRDKVAVSNEGGTHPVWSFDGRELFYRQGPSLMAVAVDTTRGFRAETPRLLFDASAYSGAGGDTSFDVAPDGQRFVMIRGEDPSVSRQIVIVHNWFDEVKRRVPSSNVLQ